MLKSRILVVDDEEPIRKTLRMALEYEGYDVSESSSGQEALVLIEREPPDLVFLDIKMPGMDGLEVLEKLTEKSPSPPVIMVSGHGTIQTAVQATKLGAFDFIEKPLETERVLLAVRNALERKELAEEVGRLRLKFERRYQMVGSSLALERVREAIKRSAPTNATVLITGESGTGKELVARAIHTNSQRARGPFVQVNCAAIPEDLIESELFGHEKGSFTGATAKQIGKFEQAHRGHHLPRRGGGHERPDAGEGPPGPSGGRGRARGLSGHDQSGREGDRGNQQRPKERDRDGNVP